MLSVYEPFDFDDIPIDIKDDTKTDYIKGLIDLAKEDKSSVYIYLILSIGFLGYVYTQGVVVIFKQSQFLKFILLIGSLSLVLSAISFFWYWRKIHKCQINLTGCLPTLNAKKAMSLWVDLWRINKILFKTGLVLIIIGIVSIGFTILIVNIFL